MKRICITCCCGVPTVHEIDETVLVHSLSVVQCPACGTKYVVAENRVARLDEDGRTEKAIEKSIPTFKETEPSEGNWAAPKAKGVN